MSQSEARKKILTHLHQLAPDQSIQPSDLAIATSLKPKQVSTTLAWAKSRGEVEEVAGGAVRLSGVTRQQFKGSEPPPGPIIPDEITIPLSLLYKAIAAVPAVKYALGILGLPAAAAIGYWLLSNKQDPVAWVVLWFVVVGMLMLMALLVLFAKMTESDSKVSLYAGSVMMCFFLGFVMVVFFLAVSTVVFKWPSSFKEILDQFREQPKIDQPLTQSPLTQPPPKILPLLSDQTTIPEDTVGPVNDPAKSRQWEKFLTFGQRKELKDPYIVHLSTLPFPNPPYSEFTLHLNVNTTETVLPVVFLARRESGQTVLMPLRQADHRQGPRLEYRYWVPPLGKEHDRLIVILGMESETYHRILQPTKFVLSSEPLSQ